MQSQVQALELHYSASVHNVTRRSAVKTRVVSLRPWNSLHCIGN